MENDIAHTVLDLLQPLGVAFASCRADNTVIERVKGGLSNAMKRAGVQWGIGRYLYKLPTTFANFESGGRFKARIDGSPYRWNPPKLEEEFLPPKPKNKKQ